MTLIHNAKSSTFSPTSAQTPPTVAYAPTLIRSILCIKAALHPEEVVGLRNANTAK